MRYDTILFDADQTLFDFGRSEREALSDALQAFDIDPTPAMIGEYSRINAATWKKLERGEITKEQLRVVRFFEFCAHFALSVDACRLAETYLERLATKSYLLEGAEDVCRTLAAHCRLYIITNGIASVQKGRFALSPLPPYFGAHFISEELGAEKPDVLFFKQVFEKIPQFEAAKTLVVGDSLTSDMQGGILAGLDTCWYNPRQNPKPENMPITYVIDRLEDVIPLALG